MLARARARRRPPKPPGPPPPGPWWLDAACALLMLGLFVVAVLRGQAVWAAWDGFWFCANGTAAVRRWQWDRYDRWKDGR